MCSNCKQFYNPRSVLLLIFVTQVSNKEENLFQAFSKGSRMGFAESILVLPPGQSR
jgi:hypothetical protein